MKRLLKSNSGFTLVEIMAAAGIAGVIGFIAYSNFKTSKDIGTKIVVDSEVNYLKNLIISNLGSQVACENTFKNSALTLNNAVQIKNKNNVVIVKQGDVIGSAKKELLTISKVSSIASANTKNNLIVTVEYTLSSKLGKVAGNKAKNAFDVNVTVMLNSTQTQVESCMVDTDLLLRDAVKASCQNNHPTESSGAYYQSYESLSAAEKLTYPYGKCTHDIAYVDTASLRTVLSTSSVPTRTKTCSPGYFLSSVTTPSSGANKGTTEYRCTRISTAPVCPTGSYLKTIVSTGAATCVPFISTIPASVQTGRAITLRNPGTGITYLGVDLNCTTVDQVLSRLNPTTGAIECIPKIITKMCGAGQFVSAVDANGNVTCLTAPTGTQCSSGYVRAVTSSGAVTCEDSIVTGTCANGIAAISSTGAVTCR